MKKLILSISISFISLTAFAQPDCVGHESGMEFTCNLSSFGEVDEFLGNFDHCTIRPTETGRMKLHCFLDEHDDDASVDQSDLIRRKDSRLSRKIDYR